MNEDDAGTATACNHWCANGLIQVVSGGSSGGLVPGAEKKTEIALRHAFHPTPLDVYDNLYRKFDAPRFDAAAWAATAKEAGMKYMVLTAKHHDGFCLWDTRATDYNVMHTPLKRDVVGELAAACRRQGVAFGTYYSVCDWHHPDFPRTGIGGSERRTTFNLPAYRAYLQTQVRELIENYGPLQVMWFDVPQEFDLQQGWENVRLCRTLQPTILVNDRAGGNKAHRVGDFQRQKGASETSISNGRGNHA